MWSDFRGKQKTQNVRLKVMNKILYLHQEENDLSKIRRQWNERYAKAWTCGPKIAHAKQTQKKKKGNYEQWSSS